MVWVSKMLILSHTICLANALKYSIMGDIPMLLPPMILFPLTPCHNDQCR